jgi:thiol:disulfide interchange protein DsbD
MTRSLPALAFVALLALASAATAQPTSPFGKPPKSPLDLAPKTGAAKKGEPSNVVPIGPYGEARIEVVPAKAKRKETVTIRLTITPKNGAHTYPFFPQDPDQLSRNTLNLPDPGRLIFLPEVKDPGGLSPKQRDAAPPGVMDQIYKKPVTWEFQAVVSPEAEPGKIPVSLGTTRLQACEDQCVSITRKDLPVAMLEVVDGEAANVNESNLKQALKVLEETRQPAPKVGAAPSSPGVAAAPAAPSSGTGRKVAKPIDQYERELADIKDSLVRDDSGSGGAGSKVSQPGLWAFMATAALWGLISLVTPCVFPMIPITVSIFLKQAHGSLWERLKLAGVYSLTIIVVLGVSAFALLKFMAWLSAHPATNIALAVLFFVLALSLFGMYDLTLPNFMARRLQARQQQGGVIGTIFGALAFTVISFTCVAPFLGGFAGISAADSGGSLISVPTTREVFGGLAFATAFAAPFFILALVPGLLRALPKSGGWLDSVKVVMGFLELAAALKFLRTAELRLLPTPAYFTYDVVLAGWIAISVGCGLYLLNLYRLPHDEERPNIGVPRLLFATLFLGLGLYLLPAMFRGPDGKSQRPAGAVYAWVEAFLLPEPEHWPTDLKKAIDDSRASGKPVFIDFTGETCTNCRYNEQNVFTRPDIYGLLNDFEKVQLYTDAVPAEAYESDPGRQHRDDEAYANREFQRSTFGDIALPLYAVILPQADGKVKILGVYDEGKINSPDRFAEFLKKARQQAKTK